MKSKGQTRPKIRSAARRHPFVLRSVSQFRFQSSGDTNLQAYEIHERMYSIQWKCTSYGPSHITELLNERNKSILLPMIGVWSAFTI